MAVTVTSRVDPSAGGPYSAGPGRTLALDN